MKWLQNFSIQTKLIAAFLLIGIFVMLAGFIGYRATATMAANAERMYERQFVPLEHLLRISDNFQRSRVYALNFLLISDAAEVQKMKRTVTSINARFDSITALYKMTIDDEDERQHFNSFMDSLAFFRTIFAEVVHLSESGYRDSAIYYYRKGPGEPASRGMYAALNGLIIAKTKQTERAKNATIARFAELRQQLIIITVGALFFAIALGLLLARVIAVPLKKLDAAATRFANGETDVSVEVTSRDELGSLATGFNTMAANTHALIREMRKKSLENAIEAQNAIEARSATEQQKQYLTESVEKILQEMERFSQGNLTVRLPINSNDDIGRLYQGFNEALDNICVMLERIKEAVLSTVAAANEISSSIGAMSANARKQTDRTKDVSNAVSGIAESMTANTARVERASEIAREAGSAALVGERVVQETLDSIQNIVAVVLSSATNIQALNESSEKITEIVQVIQEIADQTNLLALNAAIEAARAGDAGRGFAVVADEVRKLAEKTSGATKEIVRTIDQVRTDTNAAVKAMHNGTTQANNGKELASNAGAALRQIIGKTTQVTEVIADVASMSAEQTADSQQLRQNLVIMNDVTRSSVHDSERIATAISELNGLTAHLKDTMEQFTVPTGLRKTYPMLTR